MNGAESLCVRHLLIVLLFTFTYFALMVVARWYWILEPQRRHLLSQIKGLQIRLERIKVSGTAITPDGRTSTALDKLISEAGALHEWIDGNKRRKETREEEVSVGWLRRLSLRRTLRIGVEQVRPGESRPLTLLQGTDVHLQHWRDYHRLEVEALAFDETARVRWRVLHPTVLMGIPEVSAEQIRVLTELQGRDERPLDLVTWRGVDGDMGEETTLTVLNQVPANPASAYGREMETAAFAYQYRDNYFSRLGDWNNKAAWLALAALLLIMAIALILPATQTLLLVGGVGGLLAKLRSSVYRAKVPSDYGASWATLFLTPLVGALTGWAGIQLLYLVGVIAPDLFGPVTDSLASLNDTGIDRHVYGIVLLFGYSATLFDKVFDGMQETIASGK